MKKLQKKALEQSGVDSSQAQQIVEGFDDAMYDNAARAKEQRLKQKDAIKARLAARKRLADEKSREKAVNEELERISKAMVSLKSIVLKTTIVTESY